MTDAAWRPDPHDQPEYLRLTGTPWRRGCRVAKINGLEETRPGIARISDEGLLQLKDLKTLKKLNPYNVMVAEKPAPKLTAARRPGRQRYPNMTHLRRVGRRQRRPTQSARRGGDSVAEPRRATGGFSRHGAQPQATNP